MSSESASQEARSAGFKVALASTASRTLALYFSRPIRLFRPSKISGWHTLRGQSLPLLIKQKGWIVIPRHFVPPIIVNAFLGTVLWTTYSETSALLGAYIPSLSPTTVAAISGCSAGSVQALAAAPAENVRIVLEGGTSRGGWSVAWKEVFAGAESLSQSASLGHRDPDVSRRRRDEVRQVRQWVREVREMAGRGWQGLGFGVAKDSCGFAVFFAIFDMSRRAAARARSYLEHMSYTSSTEVTISPGVKTHLPRIVHSSTIVTGGLLAGLSYELICRPFDVARRCIHISSVEAREHPVSKWNVLTRKARDDGVRSFFRDPMASVSTTTISPAYTWLRALGRIGPWGVAFLAWENFGPDIH